MSPSPSKMTMDENVNSPQLSQFKTFKDFFLSEEYSDMQIICGDSIFPAHKMAVCTNSAWFKNACRSGFQESSGIIQLQEMDPIVFQRILEYLYKRSYSIEGVALDACTPVGKTSPSACAFGKRKDSNPHGWRRKGTKRQKIISLAEITGADKNINSSDSAGPSNAGSFVTEPSVAEPSIDESPVTPPAADRSWPPLTICPPTYFHARVFGDADFFMMDELKQQALAKFRIALRGINELWKVELLISELWSKNANYTQLRPILMASILHHHSRAHDHFKGVSREFLDSQPGFVSDFCLSMVNSFIWDDPGRERVFEEKLIPLSNEILDASL
ncbi:uncharacterized protein N7483_006910 [Penicillium malachiteum]|uniref:uncharacterized protein n=1 Tax=Penicillium malachiteum TaxID=1324776 RepID=UPI002546EB9D|nr:uncharacterized protein N7483_006910 [Penicillium malachiteum]KAJ5725553.1 hypothetical protein N7483_006910 [Penicillium malachiteum]